MDPVVAEVVARGNPVVFFDVSIAGMITITISNECSSYVTVQYNLMSLSC